MLTPQEVAKHSFAKASFNGYHMAQVDDFLDEVTRDYETLFNDNTLLKQKLSVLTNKIKEYQATEEAMRKTLLTAQTMAEEMVKDAEQKRDDILAASERQTSDRLEAMKAEERLLAERVERARAATEQYVAQVRERIKAHAAALDSVETLTPPPLPPKEAARDERMDEIVDAVAFAVEREETGEDMQADESAEFALTPDTQGDTVEFQPTKPKRTDKFSDLEANFGKEYELK